MSLQDFNIPKVLFQLLGVLAVIVWIAFIVIVMWVVITLGIEWIKEGWPF